jgi:SET domain-containing protein
MIQRQQQRKTIVKRAQYGWGLFAAEKIMANEFIMNYVGELFSGRKLGTATARGIIAIHLQRNYTYELTEYVDIDAACSGNASRLINDPRPDDNKTNTHAKRE